MKRTTQYRYNVDHLLEELVCWNGEAEQVTKWEYGTELDEGGHGIARADLIREKVFPHGGAVSYGYNRQGQVTSLLDQNQTAHDYTYDAIGRLVLDSVELPDGSPVDPRVLSIGVSFTTRGEVERVTSYEDADATVIANEVGYVYNGFSQVLEERQQIGDRTDGSSPKVQYVYASASGTTNTIRRVGMQYPGGQVVDYHYAETVIDDALSRVSKFVDPASENSLVAYTYLGASTPVRTRYENVGFEMTAVKDSGAPMGDAGDPYVGLDRFGRLEQARWVDDTEHDLELVNFGFDRVGNKKWRQEPLAPNGYLSDEYYTYDGLYQVTELAQGKLNTNRTAIGGAPTWQEEWQYDEVGNWLGYRTAENGVTTLNQERSYNFGNELLCINKSSTLVAHDSAGNMTKTPLPGDWNAGIDYTWDAWNRLAAASIEFPTLYNYDGLHRRITKQTTGPALEPLRAYLYDDRWQVVEERTGEDSAIQRQFTWGIKGLDDLVFRDEYDAGEQTRRLWSINDGKNVTAIVDDEGAAIVQRYTYRSFGFAEVLQANYAPLTGEDSIGWETLFCGYRWDWETGLYQVRYRYYHSTLGQWLSRDPIGEALDSNLYLFVNNCPQRLCDPLGLAAYEWVNFPCNSGADPKTSKAKVKLGDSCTPAQKQAIRDAVASGLSSICNYLHDKWADPSNLEALLDKYFSAGGHLTDAQRQRIDDILQKVLTKFINDTAWGGLTFVCECTCPAGANAYVPSPFGIIGPAFTDIHICPKFFGNSPRAQARTVVHEVTHRTSGTDDNARRGAAGGYVNPNTGSPVTPSTNDLIENAYSYGDFTSDNYYY